MARIAGINIPPHKHAEIGLTSIYGIGRTTAQKICTSVGIPYSKKIKDLSDTDLERIRPSYIRGQRQVIDVYLLALAVRMGGCLATFDTSIALGAVVGATKESVRVISAATGV